MIVEMAGSTTNGIKNKNVKTDRIAVVPTIKRFFSKTNSFLLPPTYPDTLMCRTWPFPKWFQYRNLFYLILWLRCAGDVRNDANPRMWQLSGWNDCCAD